MSEVLESTKRVTRKSNGTFVADMECTEGSRSNKAFHILVVDDEYLIRSLVPKALTVLGVTVDVAENGRQAKAKILSGNFDLVITDINMPEMNGLELLRWIKKHRPHIEGIVMTGYDSTETLSKEQTVEFIVRRSVSFPLK